MRRVKLLLLKGEDAGLELLLAEIRRSGFEPEWRRATSEDEFLDLLAPDLDVIVADYHLPRWDGLKALEVVRQRQPDTPFLLVSGTIGEEVAVAALKAASVRRAIEQRKQAARWREAEQALRNSEQRFRLAAESVSDVIYEWDIVTGAIETYGNSGERLGLAAEEMPRTFAEFEALLHPEDRDRLLGEVQETLRTRAAATYRYRVVTRGGCVRHWSCTACVVVSREGEVVRQIGAVSDVTERVAAQQRIAALNAELRELSARLMRSQDEERRRFARALHDSTAQRLTALSFSLELLANIPGMAAVPDAHRVLRESAAVVEDCIGEVRTMSYLLHPILLDDLGLEPALRNFVSGFERRTGIAVRFSADASDKRRTDCVETAVFRFVQEALSNVHRHSGAKSVEVKLAEEAGALSLEVTDDGVGFPPDAFDASGRLMRAGVGITGMRERARYLGGGLTIRSTPEGSRLQMVIPIDDAN